jgi:Tfp pilus assembly protein PilV
MYKKIEFNESNNGGLLMPCKAEGFSLIELLFAFVILSFGLTALVKTQFIASSSLKNSQERYNALLVAQQFMDHALVSKNLSNLSDKIYCNNVWYFVNQKINQIEVNQSQVTIDVRWRQSLLTLSAQIVN